MQEEVLSMLTRIYELERRIQILEQAIAEAKRSIAELREAKRLLGSLRARRVYRLYAGRFLVEVEPSEAEKAIEDEIALLEARIARLEREREELMRQLSELRAGLPASIALKT